MSIRKTSDSGSIRVANPLQGPDLGNPRVISSLLEAWFPVAARNLPWRASRTGYGALVSELMLQQTQVARVVDAFARFMERFPTVAALADADEGEVLAAWQGLGYYRRARLLHRAARAIRDTHSNAQYLPGITLPGNLTATSSSGPALGKAIAFTMLGLLH